MMKKLLVVDDEQDVLFILGDIFRKLGFDVYTASDGVEALEKVASVKPDLIILDIMMPKMDGHTVNLRLKENPETANIPVVVISAYGHVRDLLELRKDLTVTAYLEKPFRIATIVSTVKDILGMK